MSLFSNFPQSPDAEIKEEISALENRVQTVDKGGTGATTAAQALSNLGAAAVSAVGNLHVWQRVQTYADPVPEVPAGYTLGETLNKVVLYINYNSDDVSRSITCYESLTVAKDGTISGANSSSHTIYYSRSNSTLPSSIGGKFLYENSGSTAHTNAKYTDQWWYIPTDVEILTGTGDTSDGESSTRWMGYSKLQKVTGYPYTPAIPAGTTTDYLTSTDRNAYPDQSASGGQDAYYSLGDVVSGNVVAVNSSSGTYVKVKHSSTLDVSEDGTISFPTTATTTEVQSTNSSNKESDFGSFKGKFVQFSTDYGNVDIYISGIIFIPENATFSGTNNVSVSYQPVTGHAAIPANTTITYLGLLGGGARIEVGSYVGTGTYGSSNPNSLTFGFEPKAVIFISPSNPMMPPVYIEGASTVGAFKAEDTNYGTVVQVSVSGKTISWYNEIGANYQGNFSNTTYRYIAIG